MIAFPSSIPSCVGKVDDRRCIVPIWHTHPVSMDLYVARHASERGQRRGSKVVSGVVDQMLVGVAVEPPYWQ